MIQRRSVHRNSASSLKLSASVPPSNPAVTFKKRQKGLKYLIHFIGDLHQPLHAGDNYDRGGNDVQVEFLGQTITL